MNRWLWIFPILAVLLSVTIFFYWGWSWTAVGLIALVMAGTARMIWGAFQGRNPPADTLKMHAKQSRGKRSW